MSKEKEAARQIAWEVKQAGGRAFYVGGCVRDWILGKPSKDIDIEIHGIYPEQLLRILESFGGSMTIGSSFGVYALKGYHMDIAMPRVEHATGRGHRDFEVIVDPFIGPERAAARRDFTMNAILEDVLSGERFDPFRGSRDIERGVIRHVSDASFGEDPLRVLRAAQFASRLGFRIAPETVEICTEMDLRPLARERVYAELEKAMLQSTAPSVFFESLRGMRQLDVWFPEAEALQGVQQDPVYHPEGDVWKHTMRVLDEAVGLRSRSSWPMAFMLAALCHDFGKPAATSVIQGRIHAYGHEERGAASAVRFLQRLTDEKKLIRYVDSMVRLHMRPFALVRDQAGQKAFMRMFDAAAVPADLILLSAADSMGSGKHPFPRETVDRLQQLLQAYMSLMQQPYVSAADLKKACIAEGPVYSEALAYAHKLRLAGVPADQARPQVIAFAKQILMNQDEIKGRD